MKKWINAKGDKSRANEIAEELGLSPLTALVLLLRGMEDEIEMEEFLSDEFDIADPFMIKDMDKAAQRILDAIENNEKICIYGDFDADGVTSTSMMYLYLKSLWADVMYYIPSRDKEGYGLNVGAVDKLHEQGVDLIITVDNGISAVKEIAHANSLGIDVVVTDHHEPPEVLPDAAAIVDPHRKDDESDFKFLCGAGVALKLIMALEGDALDMEDILDRYIGICAIGTVADVVSLTGENRMIVREGLRRINENNDNIGIRVLRELSGVGDKDITSGEIGFVLGPRINAGGRVDIALKAVELLTTDDEEKARSLAKELCDYNARRKELEKEIVAAAKKTLDENEDIRSRKIIVVAGEGWHNGVIGLVASRIRDIYGKPTIVISYEADKARGSARSLEGFPMVTGVTYCQSLLTVFGGHPMAAGMSLPTENIDAFRDMINEYADTLEDEFFPTLEISAWLKPATLRPEHLDSLSALEPYGTENEKPVFAYGSVTITDVEPLKDGAFTKIHFKRDDHRDSAVCFSIARKDFPYRKGDLVNIAVDVKVNDFRGVRTVSSVVRDIKFTDYDNGLFLKSRRIYEEYLCGKPVDSEVKAELLPTREDFAAVYRYLRAEGGFGFSPEILLHRVGREGMTLGKLLVIIKALDQLSLVRAENSGDKLMIGIVEAPKKAELMSAPILARLK